MEMGQNRLCCICHRSAAAQYVCDAEMGGQQYWVCSECDSLLLRGLWREDKGVILAKALQLAHEDKIHPPYAINAVRGRYTVREAKRRTRLRERELRGQSVDMFDLGHRMPGDFEGND